MYNLFVLEAPWSRTCVLSSKLRFILVMHIITQWSEWKMDCKCLYAGISEKTYVSGEMKYIYQFCANTHWDWLPFDIYEQT